MACTNADCVEVRMRLGKIQINLIFRSACTNFANCMVSIDQLSVEFSARPLFTDVSFVINPKERIALVGKNGAGKSTLLKIIAGMQQPTRGCVSLQRDVTVGYLPQVMVLSDVRTVMEEAETAFAHIREMQERIERLNKERDLVSNVRILTVLQVSSQAVGACESNWQNFSCRSLTFCCLTSPQTISTSVRFSGWSSSLPRKQMR